MKANELRVGNIVLTNYGEYREVKWICPGNSGDTDGKDYDILFTDDFGDELIHILPIPLTPEILEKAGFEKFENKDYGPSWHHNESGNWIQYDKGFNGEQYLADAESGIRLDYVHQLQNLYFLYLSEELTINL